MFGLWGATTGTARSLSVRFTPRREQYVAFAGCAAFLHATANTAAKPASTCMSSQALLSATDGLTPSQCAPGQVFTRVYSPASAENPRTGPPSELPALAPVGAEDSAQIPLMPPYIVHVSAPRGLEPCGTSTTLVDFLAEHTSLAPGFVRELAAFGAVWAKVGAEHPHVSPRPLRISKEEEWGEVLPPRTPIYARLHAAPRRHCAMWPVTLILRHDTSCGTVFFVNKPPGVPVAPSSDNLHECVLSMASDIVEGEAKITSRLDVGTSGVLALGSSRDVVALVNAALQQASCSKHYTVLTRNRPNGRVLRHWVRQDTRRGSGTLKVALVREWDDGNVPADDPGGWFRAELVIESSERVWKGSAWESNVRLVTGRTHQIRVQFAAEGFPVYNDHTYETAGGHGRIDIGAVLGPYPEKQGLHAATLALTLEDKTLVVRAGPPWWRIS